jgi:hypothetical protein
MAKKPLHLIAEVRRTRLASWYSTSGCKQIDIARRLGLKSAGILYQHLNGYRAVGPAWARRYEEFMGVPSGYLDSLTECVADQTSGEVEEFAQHDVTTLDEVGELAERLETLLSLTWGNNAAMLSRMNDHSRENYMVECHSLARRIVGKCHGIVFEEVIRS